MVFAAILSALVAGLNVYLSRRTGLLFFPALVPFSAVACVICGLVLVRMRLARLSMTEMREDRLARDERPDASLFGDEGEDAPLTTERSRRQFEKVVVPAITILLFLAEAIWGLWLLNKIKLGKASALAQDELLAATFLLGQGFVLFLSSRYLTGLSREKTLRLYKGPGIATGVASLISFAAAVIPLLAIPFGSRMIVAGAYALVGILFLIAVESLLMLIVAFYSPRRKFLTGVAYESRLANFLTDPTRMAQNVVHAVDYQFGLDVSQNWYARMLKTAVVPMLATAGILVYGLTCLVVLGPEEEGILERYGRPVDEGWRLDSGIHVKKPWPFETVKRIPVKRMQQVYLGFVPDDENHADQEVLVWTKAHYKEESRFLVYNPLVGVAEDVPSAATSTLVGFLNANIPLQYEVKDLKAYAYNYARPRDMVEKTATRVLTQEMASRTLKDLLATDRSAFCDVLKQRIQEAFDEINLGVTVRFIGVYSIHPPVEAASAYEGVVDAISEKEKMILEARTYAEQVLPEARAEREKLVQEATAYMVERSELAEAEAIHFEKRLEAYNSGGDVYKSRARLATIRSTFKSLRKYVVDSSEGNEVINFKGAGGVDLPSLLLDEDLKKD